MKQISAEDMGKLIKSYRNRMGITQFELAEQIGIDDRQLSKIERGVHYPSVITFLKMVEFLNIDISTFFNSKPQIPSKSEDKLLNLLKHLSEKDIDLAYKIFEVIKNNSLQAVK